MLKPSQTQNQDIPVAAMIEHNKKVFWNENGEEEEYTPVNNKEKNYITEEELKATLRDHYKANKSSGLSSMPLQLLKHLGTEGITLVTDFLNKSAIDNKPPTTWRESKITPIYKNKGNAADPSNYRSLAITPPFTKLFMAIMNRRLT
jgi:hypothetical protein